MNNKYAHLKLGVLPEEFKYVRLKTLLEFREAVAQLERSETSSPYFLFRTSNELSLIADTRIPIEGGQEEPEWQCIKIIGEMPFGTVSGLIATLSGILKEVDIGVCVISSFDSDFFFIRKKNLTKTIEQLKRNGWIIH